MKKNYLVVFILLCNVSVFGQAPIISWQKSLGGSDADFAKDIKQTADGGYIVVGDVSSTDGDVSGNHGGFSDAWVVKLNSTGSILWQKPMGGSDAEEFRSVEPTTDGGYILLGETASFDGDVIGNHGGNSDFWLVKLDNTGSVQWQKCLGGSGEDIGYCVRQTTDGGYILTGTSASTDGDLTGNQGGPYTKDAWVVKTNSTGVIQWQKNLGTTGNDICNYISQTSDGGYILAATADRVDGDLLCSLHGSYDNWIIKLDNTGIIQWQKCLGGPGSDMANCVHENTDGTFIVLSSTTANGGDVSGWHDPGGGLPFDYWVVKLSSSGSIIWQKCLGGSSGDYPSYAAQQTQDGGFIVAGWSSSVNGDVTGLHGNEDYWIVKLSNTGVIEWQHCYGGSSKDNCLFIQQTADGGYIMAGISQSNDGDVSGNHGLFDFWVVKLNNTIVPINLVSFTGEQNKKTIFLKWQTASEQNSSYFSIDRSSDSRSFGSIGMITAAGNSSILHNYHFTDSTAFSSTNYYRLRQVDIDGKFTYSPVLLFRNEPGELALSPNPVYSFLNITYPGKKAMVSIHIYDAQGRLVQQQTKRNELPIKIGVRQLEPGIYFIKLADGEATWNGNFIKQ